MKIELWYSGTTNEERWNIIPAGGVPREEHIYVPNMGSARKAIQVVIVGPPRDDQMAGLANAIRDLVDAFERDRTTTKPL